MRPFPSSFLASWPAPNYIDPETNPATPALYVITAIFLVLSSGALCCRMYSRIVIRNWFGWDDLFVIVAFTTVFSMTACVLLGTTRFYWHVHIWDIPFSQISPSIKVLFTAKITFAFGVCTTRMSLICFYYRLLDRAEIKHYRWVLHITMSFVVLVLFLYVSIAIFTCWPIAAYWAWPPDLNAYCMNEAKSLLAAGVVNTFSEFLVAIMPIPIVMRLSMGRQQRWIIISILSLAVAVAVVGSVRTYYVWVAETKTNDLSWWSVQHWICGVTEVHLALIGACAPAMQPLLSRIHASLVSRPVIRRLMKALRMQDAPFDNGKIPGGRSVPTSAVKARLRTNASEKYRVVYASHESTVMYQTIDFDDEGFLDDDGGFGHSVSVTAPGRLNGAKKKGRRRIRRLKGLYSPAPPTKELEVVATPLDIVERRSLDIRSSWHASVLEPPPSFLWRARAAAKDVESSSGATSLSAADEPPGLPEPALLRGARGRRPSAASSYSWWEYDFMPLSPDDRSMWSHAFERVFADDTPRSSWRP